MRTHLPSKAIRSRMDGREVDVCDRSTAMLKDSFRSLNMHMLDAFLIRQYVPRILSLNNGQFYSISFLNVNSHLNVFDETRCACTDAIVGNDQYDEPRAKTKQKKSNEN